MINALLNVMSGDIRIVIINLFLLLLIFLFSYLGVHCMVNYNTISLINNKLKESEKNRLKREEELRKMEGVQERDKLFFKIDMLINQSGIRRKIPFLGTEHQVVISAIAGTVFMVIMTKLWGLLTGLVCGIAVFFLPFIILGIMAGKNKKNLEAQIVHFLNLIENYTKTEDNIITIFGKVYPYVSEPLSSALKDCYANANSTGDISMAFRALDARLGYEKFGSILRNLELCSKYEANYQVVVATSRDIMINHIKSEKKVKGIIEDAVIDLGVMLAAMFVLYNVIDSFVPGSLTELLLSGNMGIVILLYLAAVLIFSVIKIISILRI